MVNVVIRNAFILAILYIQFNCMDKKDVHQWKPVRIEPKISEDPVYALLDEQGEVFSAFEKEDSLMKKTSDVAYFNSRLNMPDSNAAKVNNCKAYFFHSEILTISIGVSNGFSAHGFIINFKDSLFYVEPFYSTDAIVEDEKDPSYKIVYQKLTLDKSHYQLGDSVYGKIEFEAIETGADNRSFKHSGKGNFRAKVGEME